MGKGSRTRLRTSYQYSNIAACIVMMSDHECVLIHTCMRFLLSMTFFVIRILLRVYLSSLEKYVLWKTVCNFRRHSAARDFIASTDFEAHLFRDVTKGGVSRELT